MPLKLDVCFNYVNVRWQLITRGFEKTCLKQAVIAIVTAVREWRRLDLDARQIETLQRAPVSRQLGCRVLRSRRCSSSSSLRIEAVSGLGSWADTGSPATSGRGSLFHHLHFHHHQQLHTQFCPESHCLAYDFLNLNSAAIYSNIYFFGFHCANFEIWTTVWLQMQRQQLKPSQSSASNILLDGDNIVLEAGRRQFKAHGGMHSSVFKDMLSIPQISLEKTVWVGVQWSI